MRVVEVGLQDFVNAAILSGLEAGEVVSLGESTTSSSVAPTDVQLPSGASLGAIMGGGGRP